MKKVVASVAAMMMMASVGFASPLTDYSQGKTAVDLNWRNAKVSAESDNFDKKYNLDWGVTTGLGNNFALQYRQFNAKSDDTDFGGVTDTAELKTKEFNLLYKLDNNLSAYTGIMRAKGVFNSSTPGDSGSTKEMNKWQIGLVGSTKIADKTTAYASVGAGEDVATWQLGLSQEIAPNLEINVDYREIKADKLAAGDEKVDAKAKGLGFGVTYKF